MSQAKQTTISKGVLQWAGLGLIALVMALIVYPGLKAALFSYWPYLLLLACPLMHVFMHRSHGGHGGHEGHGGHGFSGGGRLKPENIEPNKPLQIEDKRGA